jgi:23S rRNA pseudouridine2605 synthase
MDKDKRPPASKKPFAKSSPAGKQAAKKPAARKGAVAQHSPSAGAAKRPHAPPTFGRGNAKPGGEGRTSRKSGTGASDKIAKRGARPNLKQSEKQTEGERIAKIMARAGLCSRRDAEVWIAEGRVAVNGRVLRSPALSVMPTDEIRVDGKPLAQRERSRLFLFHKPRGLVTTAKDPEGRATVFDFLRERHPDLPRLISVGRLDINTEGLLLLTNDGGLARVIELPTTGWLRRYRVRANGETDQAILDRLADGVTIEGIHYAGIEAALDRVQGANNWMTIGLREGKNREIKRVLEHLGLVVNRLIRISFGPFQLGELAEGAVEEIRTRVLRDQLGATLAEAAGADFDSPLAEPPPPVPQRPQRPRADQVVPHRRVNPRPHRAKAEPEPEPEQEKIRSRPKPGPRKHISALRAEETEAGQQGRRRTIHSETADRKGRSVAVERRVTAKPDKARPDKAKPARGGRPGGKPQDRPQNKRQGKQAERPPRRDGSPRKPSGSPAPSGRRPPRGRS